MMQSQPQAGLKPRPPSALKRACRRAVLFAAPLALAGCAAGYKPALDQWRANKPQPYVTQTLDWVARAEAASTPATAASTPAATPATQAASLGTIRSVELEVVAAVTGRAPASLAPALAALVADPASADRLLARRRLAWPDLELAVAALSPGVRAARERWRGATEQFQQADYLEALLSRYASFTRELEVGNGNEMLLNKPMTRDFYPFPGATSLRGRMAALDVAMARIDWEMALRDALMEAGDAFFELQYLDRASGAQADNVALADDLLKVVEAQYRSGGARQADLLRQQAEPARERNMLEDLRARKRAATAKLNARLGRMPDAPLGAPADADLADPAGVAEAEWTRRALAGRQELASQRVKAELADVAVRMGETMNRPTATQGYSMLERGMMPDASAGMPMASFGGQRKAPDRPDYARGEAYMAEMRRASQAERDALALAEAQARAATREWLADLDMARRQERLMEKTILPLARSAYEAARSAYEAGGVGFMDLLAVERDLAQARLDLAAARRDLNLAVLKQAEPTGRLP